MHFIIWIHFPIQLAVIEMVYRLQCLSLDEMTFNPSDINKHGLAYTTLSQI